MGEHLNIDTKTTVAESPWSNGIVEKHNSIIGNMMEKDLTDVKYSLNVALTWCLSVKTYLVNWYGYSHNQLMFGYYPNFSSIFSSKWSEIKWWETSKGLRQKTRTATSLIYQNSDQVYYKSNDSWYCKDPAKVREINNKQVFVRYGSLYARANPCNLQLDPVKDHKEETVDNNTQDVENNHKETKNIDTDKIIEVVKENVSNKFEEQKDKESKDMHVNRFTDMISHLELNDEKVNSTKASSIAPVITSKVTYKDPHSKRIEMSISHK